MQVAQSCKFDLILTCFVSFLPKTLRDLIRLIFVWHKKRKKGMTRSRAGEKKKEKTTMPVCRQHSHECECHSILSYSNQWETFFSLFTTCISKVKELCRERCMEGRKGRSELLEMIIIKIPQVYIFFQNDLELAAPTSQGWQNRKLFYVFSKKLKTIYQKTLANLFM